MELKWEECGKDLVKSSRSHGGRITRELGEREKEGRGGGDTRIGPDLEFLPSLRCGDEPGPTWSA